MSKSFRVLQTFFFFLQTFLGEYASPSGTRHGRLGPNPASWKPHVTAHPPRISILTARTSHQTSPSKSSARADSHAATARTSVELWQPVCDTSHSSQHRLLLVWPARRREPRRVLQAASWESAGESLQKTSQTSSTCTHTYSLLIFPFRTVMGTHVNALPPPLHEYSFATVMSCDMLPWQGRGTTWPGCRREGKAVSERVTQACRVRLDFSISDGFQTFPSSCSASSFTL